MHSTVYSVVVAVVHILRGKTRAWELSSLDPLWLEVLEYAVPYFVSCSSRTDYGVRVR